MSILTIKSDSNLTDFMLNINWNLVELQFAPVHAVIGKRSTNEVVRLFWNHLVSVQRGPSL